MRKIKLWIIAVLCFSFLVSSSLLSSEISLSTANLCGNYLTTATLTVMNITNIGDNLTNMKATLVVGSDNQGLLIPTNEEILLGDIPSQSQAKINPSWSLQCNPNFPGNYTINLQYSADNFSNSLDSNFPIVITVYSGDTSSPVVLSHSVSNIVTNPYTTIEIITDEDSTCRYDETPNLDYDSMVSTFSITGGTTHRDTINGLIDDIYSYYIKCKDLHGNRAIDDYKITFDVNVPPTAKVLLDKSSPMGAGTVKVTLITSENVRPMPILFYSLDGGVGTSIPLSGSGTSWTGYLILRQNDNNKIGSFEFYGTDLTGNDGNVITSGNVFIVDTIPPEAPIQLSAVEKRDGSVRLKWQHNEEVSHYNIYRSVGDTSFSFYKTTTQKSFTDYSISYPRIYYYSVSAVDLAGNEGDLSEEILVITSGNGISIELPSNQVLSTTEKINEEELTSKIEQIDYTIDNLLDDITDIRSGFLKYNQEEFDLLEINLILSKNKVELLKLKNEVGDLKSEPATKKIQDKLNNLITEIDRIKSETPRRIRYEQKINFNLKLSDEEITEVLDKFLQSEGFSKTKKEKENYVLKIKEFHKNFKIETEAKKLIIVYLDDLEEGITLITKKIVFNEPSEAILLEYLPKIITLDLENILFNNNQFTKINSMIKTNLNDATQITFNYLIKEEVFLDDTKKIKTLLLPDFDEFSKKEATNEITGFSIISSVRNASFYDTGIVIGVILIIVLAFCSLIYKRKKRNIFSLISKKITPRKINSVKGRIKNLFRLLENLIKKRFKLLKGRHNIFYSSHTIEHHLKNSLTKLENETINSLVKKINKCVNKLNYNRALKFYCILKANYESIPSKKRSRQIKKHINQLQKKIDLLMKINLLRPCFEKKEFTRSKQLLNDIAKNYNQLIKEAHEEEMKFFNYVKLYHDNFSQVLPK